MFHGPLLSAQCFSQVATNLPSNLGDDLSLLFQSTKPSLDSYRNMCRRRSSPSFTAPPSNSVVGRLLQLPMTLPSCYRSSPPATDEANGSTREGADASILGTRSLLVGMFAAATDPSCSRSVGFVGVESVASRSSCPVKAASSSSTAAAAAAAVAAPPAATMSPGTNATKTTAAASTPLSDKESSCLRRLCAETIEGDTCFDLATYDDDFDDVAADCHGDKERHNDGDKDVAKYRDDQKHHGDEADGGGNDLGAVDKRRKAVNVGGSFRTRFVRSRERLSMSKRLSPTGKALRRFLRRGRDGRTTWWRRSLNDRLYDDDDESSCPSIPDVIYVRLGMDESEAVTTADAAKAKAKEMTTPTVVKMGEWIGIAASPMRSHESLQSSPLVVREAKVDDSNKKSARVLSFSDDCDGASNASSVTLTIYLADEKDGVGEQGGGNDSGRVGISAGIEDDKGGEVTEDCNKKNARVLAANDDCDGASNVSSVAVTIYLADEKNSLEEQIGGNGGGSVGNIIGIENDNEDGNDDCNNGSSGCQSAVEQPQIVLRGPSGRSMSLLSGFFA